MSSERRSRKELQLSGRPNGKGGTKGRHYFALQSWVGNSLASYGGSRRDRVKMGRLRLGHCGLNSGLFMVGKHLNGQCECGAPETVKHVFLQCSRYRKERETLYKSLTELGVSSFSLRSFLGLNNKNHQMIAGEVLQFLHKTKLYPRI